MQAYIADKLLCCSGINWHKCTCWSPRCVTSMIIIAVC